MQNLYAKMSVTLIFMANYILITAFAPASVESKAWGISELKWPIEKPQTHLPGY